MLVPIVACLTATICLGGQQADDPCAQGKLPGQVRKILEEKFADLRVERIGDLDPYSQQLWLKAHPRDCPGIVFGHFRSRARLSLAVLIIPREKVKAGYRLLAIDGDAHGRCTAHLLEQNESTPRGSDVLSAVPPGEYSDAEGGTQVRLTLDAIRAEHLEAGAILYYWQEGRFRKLIVSE